MRFLIIVLAALWTAATPYAQGRQLNEPSLLQTPDGKQSVTLTQEPCALPEAGGAPVKLLLARITVENEKFDGCWAVLPHGLLILAPKDKPELSHELHPVAPPGPKKGRYAV